MKNNTKLKYYGAIAAIIVIAAVLLCYIWVVAPKGKEYNSVEDFVVHITKQKCTVEYQIQNDVCAFISYTDLFEQEKVIILLQKDDKWIEVQNNDIATFSGKILLPNSESVATKVYFSSDANICIICMFIEPPNGELTENVISISDNKNSIFHLEESQSKNEENGYCYLAIVIDYYPSYYLTINNVEYDMVDLIR